MNVTDLPRSAADKLASISSAVDDAQALAGSTTKRVKETSDLIYTINDAKVLANTEHELSRLRAKLAEHQRRYSELSALLTNLRNFVQSLPEGQKIAIARPPKLQEREGDNPVQAVASIRAEIANAKQQLQAARNAPPPMSELKAQVAGIVAEWGKRGRPNIKATRAGLEVNFDDPVSFAPSVNRGVALAAWLWPKQMSVAIEQQISEMPEPVLSLSPKARDARLTELSVAIDQLERIEEGIIDAALAQGQVIERRADASPAAVLGIVLKSVMAVEAAE